MWKNCRKSIIIFNFRTDLFMFNNFLWLANHFSKHICCLGLTENKYVDNIMTKIGYSYSNVRDRRRLKSKIN